MNTLPPEHTLEPLAAADLEIKFQCASGPGGQHQNKTASACRMTHIPTGIQVFITGRQQHQNRKEALHILTSRVQNLLNNQRQSGYDAKRKDQMKGQNGIIGGRGEKVRTWNFCDSRVVDHNLNKKTKNIKEMEKGNFTVLFE